MENIFEIVDDKGVVSSPYKSFEEAMEELDLMMDEGFEFQGDVKIVEVHRVL